jgi:hypothetical protein
VPTVQAQKFALIVWSPKTLAASWRYYATRAAAEQHAPPGKTWMVVDISREPTTTIPTIEQILARTRRMDHIVYPGGRRDERRQP